MESIIETFHIDWKIIIAQAINFAVVFVVLYIYALKPLGKLMAERGDKIAKGLDDAKTSAVRLKEAEIIKEEMLAKARTEAQTIFQNGKKEAEAKKAEMMEEAKTEFDKIVNNGKKILEAEKVKILEDAKKEIVALSMAGVEKILGHKAEGLFNEKAIKELNNI